VSAPIRVLLVDDSSVVRRLLTTALTSHAEIEVVGTAANGIIGLAKVDQLEPDAVILDVEMPEMNGIATLIKLREKRPRLPVIMFSTLTERGANVTFDALAAGASDYVLKPSTQNGETLDSVVNNILVPKLIALVRSHAIAMQRISTPQPSVARGAEEGRSGPAKPQFSGSPTGSFAITPLTGTFASKPQTKPGLLPSPPAPPGQLGAGLRGDSVSAPGRANLAGLTALQRLQAGTNVLNRKTVQVVAIAASTGGPNALAEVLTLLPRGLPVPIVVVQHMPPIFTRCLADRLSSRCQLSVVESAGGERLSPGTIYIAPGNRHLEVVRDLEGVRTMLTDGPHENSCRPAADVLFRSVAKAYGPSVLCVVLTGMGQDGARGARDIHDAGGRVLAQSGPTCVIWGMPKAVEEAGIAEEVVPLPVMAQAILQRVSPGMFLVDLPQGPR